MSAQRFPVSGARQAASRALRQRPGAAAAVLALVVSVLGGFWYSIYSGLSLGGLDAPLGLAVAGPPLALLTAWLAARRDSMGPAWRDPFLDGAAGLLPIGLALWLILSQARQSGWLFWAERRDLVAMDLFAVGVACWLFGVASLWRWRAAVLVLALSSPPVLIWAQEQVAPGLALATSLLARPLAALAGAGYRAGSDPTVFQGVAAGGAPFQITIGDVCSGLAAGLSVLLLAGPALLYLGLSRRAAVLWVLAGICLATAGNLVRIVVLLVAAERAGPRFALGVIHPWLGVVILVAVFALLILVPRRGGEWGSPVRRPVPWFGIGAALTAALVAAVAQFQLLPYQGLAAGGPVGADVTEPLKLLAAADGRKPALDREIAWQDLFGADSRSYLLTYTGGADPPVTMQMVATPAASRLYAYPPERCGLYHGEDVRGWRSIDLGHGQTGYLVDTVDRVRADRADPSNPARRPLRLSVLYWYVPFAVKGQSWTARLLLILDSDAEGRLPALAPPPPGLAPGGPAYAKVDSSLLRLAESITAQMAVAAR